MESSVTKIVPRYSDNYVVMAQSLLIFPYLFTIYSGSIKHISKMCDLLY
jgi:hypothetical protein